ncbi:hypothetical protein VTK56DRAFT_136 [Thermocarpiscus australiensis]
MPKLSDQSSQSVYLYKYSTLSAASELHFLIPRSRSYFCRCLPVVLDACPGYQYKLASPGQLGHITRPPPTSSILPRSWDRRDTPREPRLSKGQPTLNSCSRLADWRAGKRVSCEDSTLASTRYARRRSPVFSAAVVIKTLLPSGPSRQATRRAPA